MCSFTNEYVAKRVSRAALPAVADQDVAIALLL
jgi:hypothetical protein